MRMENLIIASKAIAQQRNAKREPADTEENLGGESQMKEQPFADNDRGDALDILAQAASIFSNGNCDPEVSTNYQQKTESEKQDEQRARLAAARRLLNSASEGRPMGAPDPPLPPPPPIKQEHTPGTKRRLADTEMSLRVRKKRKTPVLRTSEQIRNHLLTDSTMDHQQTLSVRKNLSVFKSPAELQNCPNAISSCGKYFVSERGLKQHNRHDRPCYDCVTLKNEREFVGVGALLPPWRDRIRRIVEQVRNEDEPPDKSFRSRSRKTPSSCDTSGVRYADNRWRAVMKVEDRNLYLASFKSVEAAMLAVHRTFLVLCSNKADEEIGYNRLESLTRKQERVIKAIRESKWNHKLLRREYLVLWEPVKDLPCKTWESRERLCKFPKFQGYEDDRLSKYEFHHGDRKRQVIVLNKIFHTTPPALPRGIGITRTQIQQLSRNNQPLPFLPSLMNRRQLQSYQNTRLGALFPRQNVDLGRHLMVPYPHLQAGFGLTHPMSLHSPMKPHMPMHAHMTQFGIPGMQHHQFGMPMLNMGQHPFHAQQALQQNHLHLAQQQAMQRQLQQKQLSTAAQQLQNSRRNLPSPSPSPLPGSRPNSQAGGVAPDKQPNYNAEQHTRIPRISTELARQQQQSPSPTTARSPPTLPPQTASSPSAAANCYPAPSPHSPAPPIPSPPGILSHMRRTLAPAPSPPKEAQHISQVLDALDLKDYEETFKKQKIGIEELLMMENHDLQQLIPQMGPRLRLRSWIRNHSTPLPAAPALPPMPPPAVPVASSQQGPPLPVS